MVSVGQGPGRKYDHHRMEVYAVTIEFVTWREGALRGLPKRSGLGDQLTRAASSIALNIAEGCGEYRTAERLRFYRMARRSATECDAILDVATIRRLDTPARLAEGRALLDRILAMLTVLVRKPT